MEKIKGKIGIVAKTGGIKLEGNDRWFNPNPETRDKISTDIRGKVVELTIDDFGKIANIEFFDDNPLHITEERIEDKQAYWDRREQVVVRQNALRHATKIALAILEQKNEVVDANTLTEAVKKIAEDLENWILRK